MAAKEELFWLAPGVVVIDGKEYGGGTPLPITGINKKQLDRWKDAGKVGGKIAPITASSKSGDSAQIKKLEKQVAENSVLVTELEKQVVDKDAKIIELEKQVADLTDPGEAK